jgi:glycosyltransferase involved in cell wall biosynthesis
MVSIIICSRDEQKLEEVTQSVVTTIGTEYEIIAIDNSKGEYSIFQAYNRGVAQSHGDILCFMHEDISFKTTNWGRRVESIFRDTPDLGLVGVAGSSYKPRVPSHWSFPDSIAKTHYINIIQHYEQGRIIHHLSNPRHESLSRVAAVDGVWFCAKREVFKKVSFDDKTFSNFHGYDVDFSLAVNQYYQVAVTFDVLIEHLSSGSFNKVWLAETLKLHAKWRKELPVNLEPLTEYEQYLEEKKALIWMTEKMLSIESFDSSILKLVWSKDIWARFGNAKFIGFNLSILKFFLKRLFPG